MSSEYEALTEKPAPPTYDQQPAQQQQQPLQQQQQQQSYQQYPQQQQQGYQQYPQQQPGQQPYQQYPQQQQQQQQQGYQPYPQQGAYPPQGAYPQQQPQYHQQGYPQGQPGYVPQGQPGYVPQQQYAPGQYPPQQGGRSVVVVTNPSVGNEEYKRIMNDGLFDCFDDITSCLIACLLPSCVMGANIQESNQGSFIYGCCCWPCCFACQRSSIQRALGVADSGCLVNFCIHGYCTICALTQETRAIKAWVAAGKPNPYPSQTTMVVAM